MQQFSYKTYDPFRPRTTRKSHTCTIWYVPPALYTHVSNLYAHDDFPSQYSRRLVCVYSDIYVKHHLPISIYTHTYLVEYTLYGVCEFVHTTKGRTLVCVCVCMCRLVVVTLRTSARSWMNIREHDSPASSSRKRRRRWLRTIHTYILVRVHILHVCRMYFMYLLVVVCMYVWSICIRKCIQSMLLLG